MVLLVNMTVGIIFLKMVRRKQSSKKNFLVQRGKIFDTFFRKSSSFIFYIKADFQESC